MNLTENDVLELLQFGEHSEFEVKEARKSLPKDVWPTYSAFANTRGGIIILGIKEHLDKTGIERFEICGVDAPHKILSEFYSTLNNPQKVSRNIIGSNDTQVLTINGRSLICIYVPEAEYRQKPIYLHGNMVTHSYKRSFEGDTHLPEDELRMILRDANESDNDLRLMENYGLEDIDQETLHRYRNAFNIKNIAHTFADFPDKEFLIHMGGYVKDRATGKEGLTLAGLMMFGKGLSIRERFPNFRMDYLDLSNIVPGSNLKWNDRVTYDGRWENNLYNFINIVLSKLSNSLPSPGEVKGVIREDGGPILKAIREAVINSVIHCELGIDGVLRIERHENEIVLRNPGCLKISAKKIYAGNYTKARNPKIQDMLRLLGYGDNIGSGFLAILKAWKEESWMRPELEEDKEIHEVKLTLRMASVLAPEILIQAKELFGQHFDGLSADEKECLSLLMADNCTSNSDLQSLTGKNSWEINRILSSLVNKRFLIVHSNGRWTTYEVNHNYIKAQINPKKGQPQKSDKNAFAHPGSLQANNRQNISPENAIANQAVTLFTDDEQINEQINEQIKQINHNTALTDIQKNILRLMALTPQITLEEISQRLDITIPTLRYQRKVMSKIVIITHEKKKKKGFWRLTFI